MPPCEVEEVSRLDLIFINIIQKKIEQAGKECNDILEDRLKFDVSWSFQEKIQWCKSVTDYIQCAGKHITNCSISEVRDDVEQLSNFMEYIMKQANLNCHGKIKYFDQTFLNIFFI